MKNLKRVLSLMMAVLLCFGLFPGSAFAAENDYDGYLAMIEYNGRGYSLSENLPAPFGGHSTEKFFELRINDLTTYRTAYCIQMGVRANSGIGYESSDDYASFTEEQKALINTALTLGYNVETGTKYGGSAIDEYIATQILIWLIAHNQLGTGYESQIVNEITANSPAAKTIFYTLRENVMNYRTIPSFATDDPSAVGAYTHALQYNESTGKNETTLVDENNVLGDFTFSYPGVDFSVDGNQLHVSTSETEFGTITAEKSLPSSIPGVVTGGTKYWLRDTYQNVVTFDVEGEAQPVKCYFSLEIKSGALQIVKTSEDGEVSGIPFHISGNGVERDVVTGPDGTIGVDNLQAGTYTITERSPDRYVQPASQQVTIYPGQTSSVSFSNVLKKFTVTMEKVDSVTGEAQGDASLDGAVYGMFKGETLLDTYTTSGGGKFTTKEYPCGTDYSIREISPSEGYLLDETVYPVGAEPGNFTLEHNSYTTRTESSSVEVTSTDENGNEVTSTETVTETILEITITHKSPEEMAQQYSFNDRQNEYLALMTEPENENLWAELLGGYVSGGGQIIDPNTNWEGTGIFQWPLPQSYTITSWFGYRADPFTGEIDYHSGTDIGAPGGTPILAAADGTVTIANGIDSWGGGYGYYIKVRHNDTYETLYAHCSSICVVAGQEVKQGEVIGYVGTTGNSTGNHLHFEVRQNGQRTDALSFFRAKE